MIKGDTTLDIVLHIQKMNKQQRKKLYQRISGQANIGHFAAALEGNYQSRAALSTDSFFDVREVFAPSVNSKYVAMSMA